MSVPYTDDMNQAATYWAPTDDIAFGVTVMAAPVWIACRWQDQAVQFRSAAGQLETSSAVVYSDRPLAVGGYLALGESVTADPRAVAGAAEIRQTGSSPDLDNIEVLHKNWL